MICQDLQKSHLLQRLEDEEASKRLIMSVVHLWLLIEPDLSDTNATLEQCVHKSVRECADATGLVRKCTGQFDLTAMTLSREAGIDIQWTNKLTDHLKYDDDTGKISLVHYASLLCSPSLRQVSEFPRGIFPI